jgi:hypothetical protein
LSAQYTNTGQAYAAIRSTLQLLGEPQTRFLEPTEFASAFQEFNGELGGFRLVDIWVVLDSKTGGLENSFYRRRHITLRQRREDQPNQQPAFLSAPVAGSLLRKYAPIARMALSRGTRRCKAGAQNQLARNFLAALRSR